MAEAENPAPLPLPVALPAAPARLIALPPRNGAVPPTAPPAVTESRTLWYALYLPQLAALDDRRQQQCLQQLAALAHDFSSTVSFHACALVLEIRSSLNYFGGIEALHRRLQAQVATQLQQWQLTAAFCYAAAPTVSGSLLLARGGHNRLVHRRANLRSALGSLPVSVLQLEREPARRLHNMGVRQLQDLWRLPTDGLRKRFGSEFINRLNQALGRAPEPTSNYQPPPAFTTAYDLPCEVEDLNRLLPVADELLAQLCDFLRRRDLSTSRLVFSLCHEQQQHTSITLGLRRSSREQKHLMLLLETRLARLTIPAPVVGVRLTVKKFDAFAGHNETLFRTDGAGSAATPSRPTTTCPHFVEFMEHLQARLGEHSLRSIRAVAEHCPEYAMAEQDYVPAAELEKAASAVAANPRPLWLLPEPLQLAVHGGRLYHLRPLRLLNGPERIETRWWQGADIRRDYYVAEDDRGCRLWIFHEKTGARRWFLHGLFA